MRPLLLASAITASALSATPAGAGVMFDENVTPDVIFGSGNVNGNFTVDQRNGIELGLRGKLRYNLSGDAEDTFNSNGAGGYTFNPANANAPSDRSIFNFDWSVNSNYDGTGEDLLNNNYLLSIDYDPTAGTSRTVDFDPINLSFADHDIGDNTTVNGGGVVATDSAEYASLIANNNVAQNSWNLGFFEPAGFDPQTEGLYTINLQALDSDNNNVLAQTSIDVQSGSVPVSLPSSALLLLAGFAGLGFARRNG